MDNKNKKLIEECLGIIEKVANVAKERFNQFGNKHDEKVLYLALSTAHIAKAVLDDEFMAKFKGYKKYENLFEFGKILDKNRDLNHYDTAFWADIRAISDQEAEAIKKELAEKGIA